MAASNDFHAFLCDLIGGDHIPRDDIQALIRGFMDDRRMAEVEDYVRRGRHFADLDNEAALVAWAAAFVDRWPIFGNAVERDLASELSLRGLDVPLDRVETEFTAMTQYLERALELGGVDQEAYEDLLADLADFQQRRTNQH